jgi:hypothetical protein
MAQQTIGIGSVVNDGTGDALRTAFTKTNANFTELYTSFNSLQSGTNASIASLYTSVTSLQSKDADLTAIAALAGTSGFLKKTGENSWALSAITSGDVTTALGFTPYNATNPSGYTSNTGTVTSATIIMANGFSGTVSLNTTTPAFMLTTTVTGVLKGNGTAISAATAGTDYIAPYGSTTANQVLAAPNGSAGTPTFRALVAADIPTLPNYVTFAVLKTVVAASTDFADFKTRIAAL